jgi:hypothetical protein
MGLLLCDEGYTKISFLNDETETQLEAEARNGNDASKRVEVKDALAK